MGGKFETNDDLRFLFGIADLGGAALEFLEPGPRFTVIGFGDNGACPGAVAVSRSRAAARWSAVRAAVDMDVDVDVDVEEPPSPLTSDRLPIGWDGGVTGSMDAKPVSGLRTKPNCEVSTMDKILQPVTSDAAKIYFTLCLKALGTSHY